MSEWFVYIVRCSDGTLYTGIAVDVAKRLAVHNTGQGAKYTRSRKPVQLAWQESADSESAARKREAEIKKLKRIEKEMLLQK